MQRSAKFRIPTIKTNRTGRFVSLNYDNRSGREALICFISDLNPVMFKNDLHLTSLTYNLSTTLSTIPYASASFASIQ